MQSHSERHVNTQLHAASQTFWCYKEGVVCQKAHIVICYNNTMHYYNMACPVIDPLSFVCVCPRVKQEIFSFSLCSVILCLHCHGPFWRDYRMLGCVFVLRGRQILIGRGGRLSPSNINFLHLCSSSFPADSSKLLSQTNGALHCLSGPQKGQNLSRSLSKALWGYCWYSCLLLALNSRRNKDPRTQN